MDRWGLPDSHDIPDANDSPNILVSSKAFEHVVHPLAFGACLIPNYVPFL